MRKDRNILCIFAEYMSMKFTLQYKDPASKARAGELTTDHGVVRTPIFMPVGTAATLRHSRRPASRPHPLRGRARRQPSQPQQPPARPGARPAMTDLRPSRPGPSASNRRAAEPGFEHGLRRASDPHAPRPRRASEPAAAAFSTHDAAHDARPHVRCERPVRSLAGEWIRREDIR